MTLCPFEIRQYLRLGKVTHRRKETQGNKERSFGKTETDREMCHMKWKYVGEGERGE
jgi:hypothetical protein